jgi:putative transposase
MRARTSAGGRYKDSKATKRRSVSGSMTRGIAHALHRVTKNQRARGQTPRRWPSSECAPSPGIDRTSPSTLSPWMYPLLQDEEAVQVLEDTCIRHRRIHNQVVHKTFRYRVYPNPVQIARLAEWSSALRFLWNLAHEQRLYGLRSSVKRYYTAYDQQAELTDLRAELSWLADVPRDVCNQLLVELDRAWQRCFLKLARRPKWKSRYHDTIRCCEPHPKMWDLRGETFCFPKLGPMRTVVHRPLEGKPKTATLVCDVGEWFVCLSCKIERPEPMRRIEPVVGIDRGITVLAADSDDRRDPNPKHFKHDARRLAHAQRVVSRRKKGSKNQTRAKLKAAKIHRTIRRRRDCDLHVISARYSKSHAVVVLEDLRVANMIRNRHLAGSISDASWGKLGDMLAYKMAWTGGDCVKIDAAYSSQTCSSCGHVDATSRHEIRFRCTGCGHLDHADNNAAKVLKQRYLKELADESSVTGCGGSGARDRPVKQQLHVARRAANPVIKTGVDYSPPALQTTPAAAPRARAASA